MNSLVNKMTIGGNQTETYMLDAINSDYVFDFHKNAKSKVLIYVELKSDTKITLNVNENSNIKLVIFVCGDYNYYLNINIKDYSNLDLYTSDYNKKDSNINKTINLLGNESKFTGFEYLSAINNKIYGGFYVNHLHKNTTSNLVLNYLSNKDGYINRDAVSTIEANMDNSSSSENIKGIILSEKSRIDAKPVLVISCDDVKASHGCAIGTVDQNEIYYLMSRGLSKEDSLRIICKSLVNPFLKEASDDIEFLNLVKPKLDNTIGE